MNPENYNAIPFILAVVYLGTLLIGGLKGYWHSKCLFLLLAAISLATSVSHFFTTYDQARINFSVIVWLIVFIACIVRAARESIQPPPTTSSPSEPSEE